MVNLTLGSRLQKMALRSSSHIMFMSQGTIASSSPSLSSLSSGTWVLQAGTATACSAGTVGHDRLVQPTTLVPVIRHLGAEGRRKACQKRWVGLAAVTAAQKVGGGLPSQPLKRWVVSAVTAGA